MDGTNEPPVDKDLQTSSPPSAPSVSDSFRHSICAAWHRNAGDPTKPGEQRSPPENTQSFSKLPSDKYSVYIYISCYMCICIYVLFSCTWSYISNIRTICFGSGKSNYPACKWSDFPKLEVMPGAISSYSPLPGSCLAHHLHILLAPEAVHRWLFELMEQIISAREKKTSLSESGRSFHHISSISLFRMGAEAVRFHPLPQ